MEIYQKEWHIEVSLNEGVWYIEQCNKNGIRFLKNYKKNKYIAIKIARAISRNLGCELLIK